MAGLASHLLLLLLVAKPAIAASGERLIQLDTEDAIVFMGEEGVVLRVEKVWACRQINWPSAFGADVLNHRQFSAFRASKVADGTWGDWVCQEQPGDVLWSRGVLEAQRKLNLTPNKLPCAPWVPETGQYNREMFEFGRCLLKKRLDDARDAYVDGLVLQLGTILRLEPPARGSDSERAQHRTEVISKARATPLSTPRQGCEKTLGTLFELVECRLQKWDLELLSAEHALQELSKLIDSLPHAGRLSYLQVRDLKSQDDAVKQALQRVGDVAGGGS